MSACIDCGTEILTGGLPGQPERCIACGIQQFSSKERSRLECEGYAMYDYREHRWLDEATHARIFAYARELRDETDMMKP
jgi:hypothetical protein